VAPYAQRLGHFFGAAGLYRQFKLSGRVEECVTVQERFTIRPLLPFLEEGGCHVLAVDEKGPRLFETTRESLAPVEDDSLHTAFTDILARTDFSADLGFHDAGTGSGPTGRGPAKFHALGEAPEDYKQEALDHYARDVAKAVDGHLRRHRAPLVLVAEPNLLGMLKAHLNYPGDRQYAVNKSPAGMDAQRLHEEALAAARPALDAPRERLISDFARLAPDKASDEVQTIMRAAVEGRIAGALTAEDGVIWGRWDFDVYRVALHNTEQADSEDLVDRIAFETLRSGGSVHVAPRSAMPGGVTVAAVFRY